MPIYEYQCAKCGHHLEILQKITEQALTECPKCHQASLNKLVSATTFQLKGTGWYATDFRDKGKPKPKEQSEGSSESGGASETTAKETKKDSSSSTD